MYIPLYLDAIPCIFQINFFERHDTYRHIQGEITGKNISTLNLLAPELFFFNFSKLCI